LPIPHMNIHEILFVLLMVVIGFAVFVTVLSAVICHQ